MASQSLGRTFHRRPFTRAPVGPRLRDNFRCQSSVVAPSIRQLKHKLPDGVELELLSLSASKAAGRPPLLFLHGSYHAAWCWKEHFMPYFSAAGHDCYAVSLRAQGGSGGGEDPNKKVAGTLDTHAADLASVVGGMQQMPVVVAHSFAGLILQKYLLNTQGQAAAAAAAAGGGGNGAYPDVAGAAFLCSVPPSGNKELVTRFMKKDFMLSMRLTWAFVAKSFATNAASCRETFFSKDLPEPDLLRYQKQLAACSPVRLLDLKDMNAQVPLPPPPAAAALPPVFVAGGVDDCVVDTEAVQELARYYEASPVLLPAMAHDIMLDTRWQEGAQALQGWLDTLPAAAAPAAAGSS